MKPTIWNLFDIGLKTLGEVHQNWLFLQVTDPSFDTLLTLAQKCRKPLIKRNFFPDDDFFGAAITFASRTR